MGHARDALNRHRLVPRPRRAAAWCMVVLVMLGSGLAGGATGLAGGPGESAPEGPGGTLRLVVTDGLGAHPDRTWLDPGRAFDPVNWELLRCCLARTLLSYPGLSTAEGGGELVPDLAAGPPSVSDDGRTWTFRLRPGITYGPPYDGLEISAGDIVRAVERMASPCATCETGAIGSYVYYFDAISGLGRFASGVTDGIAGLETPDPSTLVVRLDRPDSSLPYLFALPATAPLPADPLGPQVRLGIAEGRLDDYGGYAPSTGPYMLEGADSDAVGTDGPGPAAGFRPGESLTLVRNPSWSAAGDPVREAVADRIEITWMVDQAAAAAAVEAGTADLVLDLPASREDVTRLLADDAQAGRVIIGAADEVRYLTLNLAEPPLQDLFVRRAISWALDRAGLARLRSEHLGDLGTVMRHTIPDSMVGGLLIDYQPFPTPEDAGDLQDARAEMARSSYDADGDGRCDGERCTIVVLSREGALYRAMVEAIARDLQPLGIRLQTTFSGAFFEDLAPGARIGMTVDLGFVKDFAHAPTFLVPLFTRPATEEPFWSPLGVGMTGDDLRTVGSPVGEVPDIDDRLAECGALPGDAAAECWAELDQYLSEEVVALLPYFARLEARIASARVRAWTFAQSTGMPALDRIVIED